ncbi:Rnase Y domain-containing protein, partial [Streptococcus sobrinus]
MLDIILAIVAILIGLGIGYGAMVAKTKANREAAELALLNAQQEAVTIREKAQDDAGHIKKAAELDMKAERKELLLEAKEDARKYREEVDKEFKSDKQELKQMEARLTERASSLDRKDENLSSKERTLDSKEQSLSDKSKHIDEREANIAQLEEEKQAELQKVANMSTDQARDVILSQTENELTQDIASRIKDADEEVKRTIDKKAKNLLAQAMQRLAGDYVTEQTITTVHLPDDSM